MHFTKGTDIYSFLPFFRWIKIAKKINEMLGKISDFNDA